ncbi:MAG: PCRF domain-containing protein, partial [bacterium]
MKQSILTKLDRLVDRHQEVSALLSDPDVIGDQNRFRELSQEFSDLEPVVAQYEAYRGTLDTITEAEELLKDADPDMREMAQQELLDGQEEKASQDV